MKNEACWYQSVSAEYATGEIIGLILQLLFRQFYCLIFDRVAPIKVYLTIYKSFKNSYLKKFSYHE